MIEQTMQKPRKEFVPPVALISAVLRLRRMMLRAADRMVPAYVSLLDRFMGAATTTLIHSAARLRIADMLEDGPLDAATIAARTGTQADAAERMLQALVSVGVFRREKDGRFANNHLSRGMITGAPDNIRGFAEFFGMDPVLRAWAAFPRILEEGGRGFERAHGREIWDWMASDDAARAAFVEGMSSMTQVVAPAIAQLYPFREVKVLCDVGGGVGIVLAAALARHPHLRGILYDDATMLKEAPAHLGPRGVLDRIEFIPGNFMHSVPRGADAYMLKTVLHNWDDDRALLILRNTRAAMDPGHRLLVPDFVNGPDTGNTLVPYMDIAGMMMFGGGRERTPEDMAKLFSKAGFELSRLVHLPASQGVFEGIAV